MDSRNTEFLKEVNNCKGMIHHVCNIYASGSEQQKDLYQEVLYQLWKSFPGFQKRSKFSTWLYRVALNTAITYYDKQKKKEQIEQSLGKFPEIKDEKEMEWETDRETEMYLSINQLGRIDKALILLYLEDKKYEEMAEIMGMTISNVGVRLNRARKKLESIMKNEIQDI